MAGIFTLTLRRRTDGRPQKGLFHLLNHINLFHFFSRLTVSTG